MPGSLCMTRMPGSSRRIEHDGVRCMSFVSGIGLGRGVPQIVILLRTLSPSPTHLWDMTHIAWWTVQSLLQILRLQHVSFLSWTFTLTCSLLTSMAIEYSKTTVR